MTRRTRAGVAAGAVAAAVLAVGWVAAWATREPSGPPSSSYATSRAGVAAYADLLSRFGHPVERLRTPLREADLDPGATLLLMDAGSLPADDAVAVEAFVAAGGRLVAAGSPPGSWLSRVLHTPPDWTANTPGTARFPDRARPVGDAPEVDNVRTVRTRAEGVFSDPGEATPLLASDAGAVAVAARVGTGRVIVVADASLFQNRLLARADNAAFAVAAAGDATRPVVFAEYVHGYGEAIGLSALPQRWWWALAGLVVAALALMWARGMRLGPAEDAERDLPPPRVAYVEALAASLARTGSPAAIVRPLLDRAHRMGAAEIPVPEDALWSGDAGLQVGRAFARLVKTRGGRL